MPPGPRRLPHREQQRIASALRAGDPDALRDLHGWLSPMLTGFLRQALADRDTADDVAQQVWAEVWRRGGDYDEARGSLTTWVLTIARSRAIDERRRRRPVPVEPDRLPEAAQDGPAEVDRLVERWHVAQLLTTLPDEERELLRLRFWEGLSQTEIVERTGTPLGTVKTRMVRGLERLHERLQAEARATAARVAPAVAEEGS